MNHPSGRVLALDIGAKRTGLAVSDESRQFSFPKGYILASGKKDWLKKVKAALGEHEAQEILVGIPLNQHGEAGADAENIRRYIALLRESTTLPVIEWDERFTTVQAERALIDAELSREKRKLVVDSVAASILLQSYLDSLRFHSETLSDSD